MNTNEQQEFLIVALDRGIIYGGLVQPFVVTRQWLNNQVEWRSEEYGIYGAGYRTEVEAEAAIDAGEPWFK